jgi:hypothetical protein
MPRGPHTPAVARNIVAGDRKAPNAPVITTASPLVTSNATPTIEGTAEAGAAVQVYMNGSVTGMPVTADASGGWSFTFAPLEDGTISVSATATDAAGNTSGYSGSLSLTVDAAVPDAPVITTASPFVTTDTTPAIAGTAEANATVTVYLDGVASGSPVTADGAGNWVFPFGPLDIDSYNVTATATDAAGNESEASVALALTVNAALAIQGTPVTDAVIGVEYDGFTVTATGGVPPYTFSVQSGALPAGINLDTETGEVSGTATEAGIFADIVIQVEDSE